MGEDDEGKTKASSVGSQCRSDSPTNGSNSSRTRFRNLILLTQSADPKRHRILNDRPAECGTRMAGMDTRNVLRMSRADFSVPTFGWLRRFTALLSGPAFTWKDEEMFFFTSRPLLSSRVDSRIAVSYGGVLANGRRIAAVIAQLIGCACRWRAEVVVDARDCA